jgi:uncharacterized protein (DUF2147 family)
MYTRNLFLTIFIAFFMFFGVANAAPNSSSGVTGYWQTTDTDTHKPDSIVRIWKSKSGKYEGRVVKIFLENGHKVTDLCKNCKGVNHNKSILGLKIIWGFEKSGPNFFSKGKIMDPKDGSIYKSHMTLEKNGNVLDVRGYVGLPLFGRSVTWLRVHPTV